MLDRSTPKPIRFARYSWNEIVTTLRAIVENPFRRESFGRLLNLPRFGVLLPDRIFRSGEPTNGIHFRHIQRLGIRTLVCLRDEGPSSAVRTFARSNGLTLLVFELGKPDREDILALDRAAETALDPARQPALIFCDGGRHRAGMVSGIVRHRQGWPSEAIIEEYLLFAQPSPYTDNIATIKRCILSNGPSPRQAHQR
jgi:protein tyrosine/serine phosphatase